MLRHELPLTTEYLPSQPARRRLLASLASLCALPAGMTLAQSAKAASHGCSLPVEWPQWQLFLDNFVQGDGRVLDASTAQQHSTSEGQSYGMFFALVANDPATFERLWNWAVQNLAAGDIRENLPAWIWGKDDQGQWRILDDNSASDAELWFIYSLLEAGKRWHRPDYIEDAMALLRQVEAQETALLPGLGQVLLPGPRHFSLENNLWRLNPSYTPLPLIRRLESVSPQGPWGEIALNTVALLEATCPKGFAADWVCYQGASSTTAGQFVTDPEKGDIGSYDAIRVYLWAGLTAAEDPLAARLLDTLWGMAMIVAQTGAPPEKVQTETGITENTGPAGFSAALVPYFYARKEPSPMNAQYNRATSLLQLQTMERRQKSLQPSYYDHVLNLFSTGWQRGHYRFAASGDLHLQWDNLCPNALTP